ALEYTLDAIPNIKSLIKENTSTYISEIYSSLDELRDIKGLINKSICDEPPLNFKDGGVIKKGYDAVLDDLKNTAQNTKEYIASIELSEREKTGIKNLKIGFNKVFGYYIEITKSNIADAPNTYIRKQTLTNCERYITEELKIMEEKILSAKEGIEALELKIYNEIISKISEEIKRIQTTANAIALLDVYSSLAKVSLLNSFTKPTVDMSGVIDIKDGRHCVVESMLKNDMFVANDVYLDKNQNQIALITGPNMAGKSTYMRQVAIICILAQIGCFVPAKSARIGVVDGIYTRVGASDDLSSGQSTFMVEMNEVANILKNATSNSLLILDEIGRGTSTYDGMSIARAVLEHIANKKKLGAKTLFATHYHELTNMDEQFECIHNFNIAVKKRGDDVIFLRRILKGGTDDSFGIYVSKLAGIPNSVVQRAKEILEELESGDKKQIVSEKPRQESMQMSFEVGKSTEIENRLKDVNLDDISPKQALAILYELKDLI
ncbi:MAG: DNA mismatch repair protein MutS, partial [Oscillospiraceae bacterium]